MHYLSICALALFYHRNEAEQWYKYHLAVGVDHFYLVDDGSKFDLYEVFEKKHLTLLDAGQKTDRNCLQHKILKNFPSFLKTKTKWVALIDTDEYLLCQGDCFKSFLSNFENESSVELKLKQFRADGSEEYQANSIILSKFKFYHDAYTIKTIANLSKCEIPFTRICIHRPFDDGVDALGNTPLKPKGKHRSRHHWPDTFYQPAWINHYPIRDLDQLKKKYHQGRFGLNCKDDVWVEYILNQTWGAIPRETDQYFNFAKYHRELWRKFKESLSYLKNKNT